MARETSVELVEIGVASVSTSSTSGRGSASGASPACDWVRDDRGISLVEVMVAMGLTAILGAMTLLVFLGLNNAARPASEQSFSASEARVVLDSWNRLVQLAESPERSPESYPAFESITSHDIIFYASLDNRSGTNLFTLPTRVRIANATIEGRTSVVECRYAVTAGGWALDSRRILVPNGSVSFTAVDGAGTTIAASELGAVPVEATPSAAVDACLDGVTEGGETPVWAPSGEVACPELAGSPGETECGRLREVASVHITITVNDQQGGSHVYRADGAAHQGRI